MTTTPTNEVAARIEFWCPCCQSHGQPAKRTTRLGTGDDVTLCPRCALGYCDAGRAERAQLDELVRVNRPALIDSPGTPDPGTAPRRKRNRPSASLRVDSREQLAYDLARFDSPHIAFTIERTGLVTGDYVASLGRDDPPSETIVVERKSLDDLLSTITRGRQRFENELARMRDFASRHLVIESDISGIVLEQVRVQPEAVLGSLIAFSQRFTCGVWFASTREFGERLTWKLLERFCRDRLDARQKQQNPRTSSHQGANAQPVESEAALK